MATFEQIQELRKQVAPSLLRTSGVQGVATGYKRVKGKRTDELAIIVYVAKKIHPTRLPVHHTIPSSIEIRDVKVPTDVVEVGYYTAYSYTGRERPAQGGDSIGHPTITSGTLGGLICDYETQEIVILSNNHVLAAANRAQIGDHIVQPGAYYGGHCHEDCIAELQRLVGIDFSGINYVNYVDCAIAKPYDLSDVSFTIRRIGTPSLGESYELTTHDVQHKTRVQKTGSTTEHTEGEVEAVDWSGYVWYDWGWVYFEEQIKVVSLDHDPVVLGGDSGSLVLTKGEKYPRICGLLFGGTRDGDYYLANHIGEVFNRLNVGLCCSYTEAVRGTDAEEFLPDLREFRDRLRKDEELRKPLERYLIRHSGVFFEAMLRKPELKEIARVIIEDVGKAIRHPRQRIDRRSVELGLKFIDAVSEMRRDDEEFLKDMQEAKGFLRESAGRTIDQTLRMPRE